MPIPELEKFREKYPQYNDMDDATIANRLAEKYPDAYGDLPGKVNAIQTQVQPQTIQKQPPFTSLEDKLSGQGNWLGGAAVRTAKDVATIPAHFANQALFNIPRAIMNKMGGVYPETENVAANLAAKGAGVAGMVMGGGKVFKGIEGAAKTIPALSGNLLRQKMARGAIAGAGLGAVDTRVTPKDDIVALPQRMGQAMGGAIAGGLLTGLGATVAAGKRWLSPKNQLKLAEEARNNLFAQKQQMVEGYGKQYESIVQAAEGKNIALNDAYRGLMENTDDALNSFSQVEEFNKAVASNNPTAKRLLNLVKSIKENNEVPTTVSVKEADMLQKFIKQLPGIKGKLERGYKTGFQNVDWTNEERIILDFANDIKASVLDTAPELKALNQNYGQFMNNYKMLRPYLKWNTAIQNFMDIHNPQKVAILDLMQKTLPKNIMGNVMSMNRTVRTAAIMKAMGADLVKMGLIAGGVGGLGYGITKALRE